ncbi:MAG: hypothetical protein WB524_12830 [Acidobacteriaceae bacterium]|jgi:hypothetical protein
MALFDVHPWAQFIAGMLTGCWIGAAVACVGVLLVVGRRVRQLETLNLLLRTKLKARMPRRMGTSGTGPTLVMPLPSSARKAESVASRIARVN